MIANNAARLNKEEEMWKTTPPTNIRGTPLNNSKTEWEFALKGPVQSLRMQPGSPYAHIFMKVLAKL